MNSKKHKLPRRILAMLLAICMFVTMFPSAMFAVDETGEVEKVTTLDDSGIQIEKSVKKDADGNLSLEIDAWATGEKQESTTVKPVDIVLVLDQSGSMGDGAGVTFEYNVTEKDSWSYSDLSWNWNWNQETYYFYSEEDQAYYPVDATREWISTGFMQGYWQYSLVYTKNDESQVELGEISRDEDAVLYNGVLYTRQTNSQTKLSALKEAANAFIDTVNQNQPTSGGQHRIAIVGFASNSSSGYTNTEVFVGGNQYRYSDNPNRNENAAQNHYSEALQNADSQNLKNSINALAANGGTYTNLGLEMANGILNTIQNSDREKVVIVFTDGEPGRNGYDGNVANAAIAQANAARNNGATVYSVGVFGRGDETNQVKNFMTSLAGEASHYLQADDPSGLTDIFEEIADEISQPSVEADETSVLTDVLSDYFTVDNVGSGRNITVQTVPYDSDSGTWGKPQESSLTAIFDKETETISVTGFDYSANYISEDHNGAKLRLTIPIKPDTDCTDWGESRYYDTNASTEVTYGKNESVALNGSPNAWVDTYTVSYDWGTENVPGNVALPINGAYYITGQTYAVDTTYTNTTVVEVKDDNGNVTDRYTFSGWKDSNNGTISGDNVTITGSWNHETVTVEKYQVTYSWSGLPEDGTKFYDANGKEVTLTRPTDPKEYALNETYTVDSKYTTSTEVYTHSADGKVDGAYIFSGWNDPANGTMVEGGVTINGSWKHITVPTGENLDELLGDVSVDCTNILVNHEEKLYKISETENGYTLDDLVKSDNGFTVKVTISPDAYVNAYSDEYPGVTHTPDSNNKAVTVSLKYEDGSWEIDGTAPGEIAFYVNCNETPDQYINGFSKDVIDLSDVKNLPQQINQDNYVIPANEKTTVTIPYDGEVTLLYAITVQGKGGTNFTVTDVGATLVETDAQVTQGKDDKFNEFTGMIPNDATSLTFYVSKTFDAEALENSAVEGMLVNTASIAVKEGGLIDLPDDPENPSVTEEVPGAAEEKPDVPDNIDELLKDASVTVECVKDNVEHSGDGIKNNSATYGFSSYSTGDVTPVDGQDGVFTLTVSIESSAGAYIGQFDSATEKDHIIATGEDVDQDYTVTLKYQNGSWALDDKTAHLKVECEYDLTDIQKTIVTSDQADAVKTATSLENLDEYVLPDKVENEVETVVIPYGGSVKLIYSITVTGKDGAKFDVEDTDAKLLGKQPGITFNESNSTFTGTIPTDANTNEGTITFYVWKEFNKDSLTDSDTVEDQKVLINTATLDGGEEGTTGEDEDTEIVPGEEGVQTFKLTYDGNAIDGAKVEKVPEGSDGYKDGEKVEISAQIPTYSEENVVFIGWSREQTDKIYSAGENYEEKGALVGDSVIFKDSDITLYAVWGYDTNGDGTADATQVFITPADITAYTGGQDYSGVVDAAGNIIEDLETNAGLPEPGYFITLPYDAQQWVNEQAGGNATAADLSKYLTFTYSGSVEGQTGDTTREWGLVSQGNYDATRYVYSLTAGVVDGNENNTIPVRLSYFTDSNGDGKPSSDEILDENIIMTEDSVCNTFSMTINSGGLNQGEIKATFNASTETTVTDGPKYSVAVGTGTLTVKSVVNQDTTNTNAIVSDADSVDTNVQTAVAGEGVTYLVNDSEVQVPVANDRVQLLVDSVSNNNDFNTQMGQDAIATVGGNTDTHDYELVYMDLVDTQNGNVEVTLGDDDSLTIYWPMPEDADENGTFQVVHYTDMDREETVDNLSGVETETLTVTKTRINGQVYLTFSVDSFSPFALVYETDNGGNQGGGGWTPDGGDDGPDGLNTEDHFSYIVGYAEDYRTGEPTDNEDLWPVKPNNQITRAEVATIFYRLLEDEVRDEYDTTANDFSDVSADSWYNQTVSTLASMGIVKGYEDGTFRPNAPITRAEFGAIATRFFAETGATYEPGTFSDVTGDEWYANAIQDAVNLGLIGGYEDGTVRPNNNITRAEACAIVNRTLGRVPDADHLLPDDVMKTWPDNPESAWFYADMQEATNGHEYSWITEDGNEVEEWISIMLDNDWTDR